MAQNKTTENNASVSDFIDSIAAERREDARQLDAIFEKATGLKAKMWGNAIIGYGSYHYKYDSGREGDMLLAGFSPRSDKFALYLSSAFGGREEMLSRLGKCKTAKACVYIRKVSDIDTSVLEKMIAASVDDIRKKYP